MISSRLVGLFENFWVLWKNYPVSIILFSQILGLFRFGLLYFLPDIVHIHGKSNNSFPLLRISFVDQFHRVNYKSIQGCLNWTQIEIAALKIKWSFRSIERFLTKSNLRSVTNCSLTTQCGSYRNLLLAFFAKNIRESNVLIAECSCSLTFRL